MRFPRVVVILSGLMLLVASVQADETQPEQKPGLMRRMADALHLPNSSENKAGAVQTKNLILNMELSPLPLKLSETRQLKAVISLTNKSRKIVSLDFPTTQRFEIVVRDKSGKQVFQWSEDQAFATEQTIITINPRERIEYDATVATRDLSAGNEYVVEGSFPKYKELKIQKTIVPQK
ncbi:MAG: BsuPI-related putative proteinase inhibitor [Verrucomicrobiota bacterium]